MSISVSCSPTFNVSCCLSQSCQFNEVISKSRLSADAQTQNSSVPQIVCKANAVFNSYMHHCLSASHFNEHSLLQNI